VEFITFIWLVLSGLGVIALLMLVQEARAFCSEARHIRHVLRVEMMELQRLLSQQESSRICRAAREAEERLSAVREGRGDGQKNEWIADLIELRRSILTWLSPVVEANSATS
jgi:hypothetical protein